MNPECSRARAAIADALFEKRDPDVTAAAHIQTCDDCRAYQADCANVWSSMGHWEAGAPSGTARDRFEASAKAVMSARASRVSMRTRWLAAASIVAALLLGYGAARWNVVSQLDRGGATTAGQSPQFLLLLYDRDVPGAQPSAADIAATVAEHAAWARALAAAGQLVSAEKLRDTPPTEYGGPEPSSGDRLGGFFLIRARDLAEAQRIARDCPLLKHGGRVELRVIEPT